jgi:methylated-DNA-[protein]-cysteine S-methyltransferase
MTNPRYRTIESPVGFITIAGDHDGTITALRMEDQAHPPAGMEEWEAAPDAFSEAVAQLEAYFAGERTEFDLPLRLDGTDFQRTVWAGLLEIPYGETISYGELASRIGKPNASRAVGLANGRNPVAIIVPCHRVIGAGGSLTGYGGGLDRKRTLLDLERAHREPQLIGPSGSVRAD